jgi:hypothetical protein
MCRLTWVPGVLLLVLIAPVIGYGQSTSNDKPSNEPIIRCRFAYIQFVRFSVTGKNKKEITDLKHTDILIYENGRPQDLYFFTDEPDTKQVGYRYTIGYVPENQKEDGKYHRIKIVTKAQNGNRLDTHLSLNGYYATKGYFNY